MLIKEGRFLDQQIGLPPLTEQQAIVGRLDALAGKAQEVEAHLDAVERDAEHLLALRFRDVIADAPLRTMAEVAPLVRREQTIDLDGIYPELGIRSFGKGTFHKPPLSGGAVRQHRIPSTCEGGSHVRRYDRRARARAFRHPARGHQLRQPRPRAA